MYTVNMYSGAHFWYQKPKTPVKPTYKAPEKCIFCGKKIEDRDYFYAGYDQHRIYAETCDDIKCHQWLENKIKVKKIKGKDYIKEVEQRERKKTED